MLGTAAGQGIIRGAGLNRLHRLHRFIQGRHRHNHHRAAHLTGVIVVEQVGVLRLHLHNRIAVLLRRQEVARTVTARRQDLAP